MSCPECDREVEPIVAHSYTYGDWQEAFVEWEDTGADVHAECCRVCKREGA